MLKAEGSLAALPAYAAHRAVHRRRGRRATPPAALALWPRGRARQLLRARTRATLAASRRPGHGVLPVARHRGTHRDLHSVFRARTAMVLAYRPPGNESAPARCHATLRLSLLYRAPR